MRFSDSVAHHMNDGTTLLHSMVIRVSITSDCSSRKRAGALIQAIKLASVVMTALLPTSNHARAAPCTTEPAFQRSECRLLRSEASRRYRVESRARHDCDADIRAVHYYRRRQLDRGGQTLKNSQHLRQTQRLG
jgi:hypothetical protein